MPSAFLSLAALGPISLAGLGSLALAGRLPSVDGASRAAIGAALVALCIAVITGIVVAAGGPLHTPLLGFGGVGFSLFADRLTAAMFLLVSFIGVIVVAYSRNYLGGDPGHVKFTGDAVPHFISRADGDPGRQFVSVHPGVDCHQHGAARAVAVLPGPAGGTAGCAQEVHCKPDGGSVPRDCACHALQDMRQPGIWQDFQRRRTSCGCMAAH